MQSDERNLASGKWKRYFSGRGINHGMVYGNCRLHGAGANPADKYVICNAVFWIGFPFRLT